MDYPVREIETKWQRFWEARGLFKTNPAPKNKFYVLVMYPYPSGDLHMGHIKNYVIGDLVARLKKLQGYDVLHPFGWDAFGLPSENAAIERGISPEAWTMENIRVSRESLKVMGIGYDWDTEVTTCLPDYYKWNQWLFIKLFERGLAYRKEAYVNWCTGCKTVLANEQVKEGHCYRSTCGQPVIKKKLEQWFFKITEYSEKLLAGLDHLPHWPENVKTMQRYWIGKSEGTEVDFTFENGEKLPVFTTRPDTLFGCTFLAVAPDAPIAETIAQGTGCEQAVTDFINQVLQKPEIERTALDRDKFGVFAGRYALNPVNGEKIPIWITDYVLASYGTGVVMCVPAHDQRDFEFARKYGIPIRVVIQPPDRSLDEKTMTEAYTEVGSMVNSKEFNGIRSDVGIEKITRWLESQSLGRLKVNYRQKDWLISRQRYWGTPIPMIHCQRCGIVPVPEKDLPVLLPQGKIDYIPKGRSPLADVPEFINTTCRQCGGKAERDPDTMDTFVDSSWYFLRYLDPKNDKAPFTYESTKKWMPVDHYIGGIEHACGHLIFSRFFTKFLYDLGMVAVDEPAQTLTTHGMVHLDGKVMSSSKRHGVWVGPFSAEHGADVARLTILFAAPAEKDMEWNDEGVVGAERFLNRVYRLFRDSRKSVSFEPPKKEDLTGDDLKLYIKLNQMIKKVTEDSETMQFNTAIAALMELLNELTSFPDPGKLVFRFALGSYIILLSPFAPHLAEEIWHMLAPWKESSIFEERWVGYDSSALTYEEVTIPIQVNGRLRSKIAVPADTPEDKIKEAALADPKIRPYTEGHEITKVIYVTAKNRGGLVNIVVQ
jgi:leucyl-tRNA synthetase